jgi:FAD/FMN-containing dehydrogenase
MTPVHSSAVTGAHPAPIVRAATPADIRAAVLTARARGLRVAVRATGHGTFAEPARDTLLIDTSRMASVLVDPDRRTARVGPGATWGEVIEAAAPFGLAPVSGTNATVGVTGFTLGGGHGFLSRKHGLAADNLIRADVVIADGQTLTAREDRRSGLFWALCGAGGNFGVATALEFKLHPVREVFGGIASFDRGLAPHILARFREYAMPEELNVSVVVTPDAVALRGVYAGGADDAWRALAPLFLGEPFKDTFRTMPYSETGTIGGTAPRRFELLQHVPVDAILRTAETAAAVEVKRWGGAIARGNTPAGHRSVPFSVTVDGEDLGPLAPHVTGGSFLNFLKDTARTRDAYTAADYARLLELKRAYDPDNLFGVGHRIVPATTAVELAA